MCDTNQDKRAVFDFEIEFSNGGGIQGQDFRLDIEGDDISDDALADYLVRDLRLLMVGSVRILHKRIIAEPHKRFADWAIASGNRAELVQQRHRRRRIAFLGAGDEEDEDVARRGARACCGFDPRQVAGFAAAGP